MDLNLISATLSPEDEQAVREALATLKSKLPFFTSMQNADVSSVFKVGTNYQPFLDLAKQVVESHPQILPAVFNKEEFANDYRLYRALQPLANEIAQLNEGAKKSIIASGSDTIDAALEVYAAVRQHKDKVPGLSVIYTDMADFFKRGRRKS